MTSPKEVPIELPLSPPSVLGTSRYGTILYGYTAEQVRAAIKADRERPAAGAEPVAWRALGGEWNEPQDMEYRYGPWVDGLDPLRFQPLAVADKVLPSEASNVLRDLDQRLRACFGKSITAEEAYDSSYQEIVSAALRSGEQAPEVAINRNIEIRDVMANVDAHALSPSAVSRARVQRSIEALVAAPAVDEGVRKLARYGAAMLHAHRGTQACEVGDIDGGTAQDSAVECGVLESRVVTEPCGEDCVCAEVDDFPLECYFVPDDVIKARAQLSTSTPTPGAGGGSGK
jgi:hypothetical protein